MLQLIEMSSDYSTWTPQELIKEVERLQKSVKGKRFGLVWQDIPEAFEAASQHKLPILTEIPESNLLNDGDKPTHIMIEGDNYHALTCLNYSHKNKVDLIYIDPPYNTGSDGFRYKDKRISDTFPDGTEVPVDHPFRHSYWLSFMSKRLELAYPLLKEDGLLAISIDDNEYAQLRLLLNDTFGSSVKTIGVKMSEASGLKMAGIKKAGGIPKYKEYLVLAKKGGIRGLNFEPVQKEAWDSEYNLILENFTYEDYENYADIVADEDLSAAAAVTQLDQLFSPVHLGSLAAYLGVNKIPASDKKKWLLDNSWRICRSAASSSVKKLADAKDSTQEIFAVSSVRDGLLYLVKGDYDRSAASPRVQLLFARDNLTIHPGDLWSDIKTTGLEAEGGVEFKNGKKPLQLIKRLVKAIDNPNAVILDFFAGSGTTLEAVAQTNKEDGGTRQCLISTNNENNIALDKCYARAKNVLVTGYGSTPPVAESLKYYKTDFVGSNYILKVDDADHLALAQNAGALLALAENTLYEVEKNAYYQIFEGSDKCTAVYFREELTKYQEFIDTVNAQDRETVVYVFTWGEVSAAEEFTNTRITLKAIPQPILEVYRSIYNIEVGDV